MKKMILTLSVIFLINCSGRAQPALTLEPAFPELRFTRPVDLQHAPGNNRRLYVMEQAGIIYSFENKHDVSRKIQFLDVRDLVDDSGNEEGLLGLAFHPDFESNGYFFIDYTAGSPDRTVIARYHVNPEKPLKADANSAKIILEIPQPYSNHNGGQISFGPDGYLYIAMGDGGAGGDPHNNGQDPSTLLAAILRIDVNAENGKAYAIPPDNPFVGNKKGYREEVYAYGLRNPWRFSFDAETGELWAGDVGQNKYEEVDYIIKGGNYGWNIREGFHPYQPEGRRDKVELPVTEYSHQAGQSITGGFVYRGSRLPELQGYYIYTDYVSGRIWAFPADQKEKPEVTLLLDSSKNISSFGVDAENEMYLCAFDGFIYRFKQNKERGKRFGRYFQG
ncbi:MAG: PQQ-dependent sugar dehydrogenase [Calditrichia bacterium]